MPGGPAGLVACLLLAQQGYTVDLYEMREDRAGEYNVTPRRSFFYFLGIRAQQALEAVRGHMRMVPTCCSPRHTMCMCPMHAGGRQAASKAGGALWRPDQGTQLALVSVACVKVTSMPDMAQGGSMGRIAPVPGAKRQANKLPGHMWVERAILVQHLAAEARKLHPDRSAAFCGVSCALLSNLRGGDLPAGSLSTTATSCRGWTLLHTRPPLQATLSSGHAQRCACQTSCHNPMCCRVQWTAH